MLKFTVEQGDGQVFIDAKDTKIDYNTGGYIAMDRSNFVNELTKLIRAMRESHYQFKKSGGKPNNFMVAQRYIRKVNKEIKSQ